MTELRSLPHIRVKHTNGNTVSGRLDQVLGGHLAKGWTLDECTPALPTREQVMDAVLGHFNHTPYGWRLDAGGAADAVLALFGGQES